MDLIDFQEQWHQLFGKVIESNGIDTLTPDEKVWYTIQCLINAIQNGGLISFYYNSGADLLDDTIQALRALDSQKMIGWMMRVNELFPGGVPKDILGRNQIIESWPDGGEGSAHKFLEPIEDEVQQEAKLLESKLVFFIIEHNLIAGGLHND